MIDSHHGWNRSLKPLILGFIFSVIFTLAAYRIITHDHLKHSWLIATVIGVGLLQVIFQLVFFLHIGLESKPRWNILILLFTLLLIAVLVLGTLWIMYNLSYNLML